MPVVGLEPDESKNGRNRMVVSRIVGTWLVRPFSKRKVSVPNHLAPSSPCTRHGAIFAPGKAIACVVTSIIRTSRQKSPSERVRNRDVRRNEVGTYWPRIVCGVFTSGNSRAALQPRGWGLVKKAYFAGAVTLAHTRLRRAGYGEESLRKPFQNPLFS
jgi:hypothetical protein